MFLITHGLLLGLMLGEYFIVCFAIHPKYHSTINPRFKGFQKYPLNCEKSNISWCLRLGEYFIVAL